MTLYSASSVTSQPHFQTDSETGFSRDTTISFFSTSANAISYFAKFSSSASMALNTPFTLCGIVSGLYDRSIIKTAAHASSLALSFFSGNPVLGLALGGACTVAHCSWDLYQDSSKEKDDFKQALKTLELPVEETLSLEAVDRKKESLLEKLLREKETECCLSCWGGKTADEKIEDVNKAYCFIIDGAINWAYHTLECSSPYEVHSKYHQLITHLESQARVWYLNAQKKDSIKTQIEKVKFAYQMLLKYGPNVPKTPQYYSPSGLSFI